MTVAIGLVQTVAFRKGDGLDDVEAAGGAVVQIDFGLFQREAVEELPRRVGEIEERLAVSGDESTAVVGNN